MVTLVIVGAGPVGMAAALALEQHAHVQQIHIYDRLNEIPHTLVQSYPIGVNNRGMQTLRMVGAEEEVKRRGCLIHGWRIFVKTWQVASIESKQCWGTTRGKVNKILYDLAVRTDKIKVHFGHKLIDVDFDTKTLKFVVEKEGTTVQQTADLIFACDGLWSATRTALEKHWDDLKVQTWPWERKFRCLYSQKATTAMDSKYHNILTGNYTAILEDGWWSCTVGMPIGSELDKRLSSTEGTPENIAYLRKHLHQTSPQTAGLFDDEELAAFFTRKCFQGAIVKVSRLQYNDFVVLLGDAAHSVFPATGEGINSGLEDVKVLMDVLDNVTKSGKRDTWFQEYERVRYEDTVALCDLAKYAEGAAVRDDSAHKWAYRLGTAVSMIQRKVGKPQPSKEDLLFGMASKDGPFPYSQVVKQWKQELWLLPKLYSALTLFSSDKKTILFETDAEAPDCLKQVQVEDPTTHDLF